MEIKSFQFQGYRGEYLFLPSRTMPEHSESILFIGGAFQDIRASFKIGRDLARNFNVIMVDLPGSGNADSLPHEVPFSFLSESAADLCRLLDIERYHIIGCSYGSPVAYALAQLFPERVARMVLTGVMREIPSHTRSYILHSLELARNHSYDAFNDFVKDMFFNVDYEAQIPKQRDLRNKFHEALKSMSGSMVDKYIQNTLRLLKTRLSGQPVVDSPILVMTGEWDSFTAPADCAAFVALCPKGQYTSVLKYDHFFHVEQHHTTIALVRAFLLKEPWREIPGHGAHSVACEIQA